MAGKIEKAVLELASPIAEKEDCEVLEIEYKKEGQDFHLRVFLDSDVKSVDLDTCEKVSRALSEELDRVDPIKDAYILEVCSPGLDRALRRDKDFKRFMGSKVDVKLFAPIDGVKEFSGVLEDYGEKTAYVKTDNKTVAVKTDDAVYIRLKVEF